MNQIIFYIFIILYVSQNTLAEDELTKSKKESSAIVVEDRVLQKDNQILDKKITPPEPARSNVANLAPSGLNKSDVSAVEKNSAVKQAQKDHPSGYTTAWEEAKKDADKAWKKTQEVSEEAWETTKKGSSKAWDSSTKTSKEVWQITKEGSKEVWTDTQKASTNAWQATKQYSDKAWKETKSVIHEGASYVSNKTQSNIPQSNNPQSNNPQPENKTTATIETHVD